MKYPSKTLIKNITPVPRSLSEATRDAQYCNAIQTFKSDAKLACDFLADAFLGFLTVSVVFSAVGAILYWFLH